MKREGRVPRDRVRLGGGGPSRGQRLRAAFTAAVILALFAGLGVRLYCIQIAGCEGFRRIARAQVLRTAIEDVRRGSILDRRGHVLAASLYREPPSAEIAVDPTLLRDLAPVTVLEIAALLGLPQARTEALAREAAVAAGRGRAYLRLVEAPVEPARAEAVRRYVDAWAAVRGARWRRGVLIRRVRDRVYTYRRPDAGSCRNVLLSVLGALDRYGQTGVSGIERLHDAWLRGCAGRRRDETGPGRGDRAYPRLPSREGPWVPPLQPADVILTIDSRLQRIAAAALADAVTEERADRGVAIVLDPRDGGILAMANADRGGRPAAECYALTLLYEPGSVMKPFVATEALARGIVRTGGPPIWTGGRVRIARNGRRIVDHRNLCPVTFERALTHSSNVGFSILGERLGRRGMERVLERFGFDGAPAVAPRLCPAFKPWRKTAWTPVYSEQSMGYGYELLVTPLGVARAFAAFANGGWLVAPRLVRELVRVGPDGRRETIPGDPVRRRRAIPEARVRRTMRRLLAEVVRSGTGRHLAIPGIPMAVKTGTTKKWVNGSYGGGHYYASFVAFVPVERPRYVLYALVDEPRAGSHYGSQVAGPIVARIVRALRAGVD